MSVEEEKKPVPPGSRVCLVGVGGGALRVLERFREDGSGGLDLVGIDTDAQCLERYPHIRCLRVGRALLRGLGCGGDEEMGRLAAESDRVQVGEVLSGYDLAIFIACLGRGFASGALASLVGLAGEGGCPTAAIVSRPFDFEGSRPAKNAKKALAEVRMAADCVIELPNDLLFQEAEESDRADQLFRVSDEWMFRAVAALTGPLLRPSRMGGDLATFRKALRGRESRVHFSTCRVPAAEAAKAVEKALFNCPFRSAGIEKVVADQLLVSIGTGSGLSVAGLSSLTSAITGLFDSREDARIGLWEEASLADEIEVTVLARTDLSSGVPGVRLPEKVTVHKSKLAQKKEKNTKSQMQTEFDVLLEDNERGLFGRMATDAYNGIDLDKPTFLRRGIKIPMPKNG